MLDVHIRTIDRGSVNYIKQTIGSLAKDKTFENYEIKVFDSGSEDLSFLDFLKKYSNVKVKKTDKRLSAMENFIRALGTEKEWVLVLGDDFRFCNDFFQNMEKIRKHIADEMRVIPFFLTYREGLRKMFFELDVDKFWGGNFLIRQEDAKDLAKYLKKRVKQGQTKHMDIWLKHWHKQKYGNKPIYMVGLGMCQHIGDESALEYITKRRGFVARTFPQIWI